MKIYMDMDDVLTDWIGGFEKHFPYMPFETFLNMKECNQLAMVHSIDHTKDHYLNLEPNHKIVEVTKRLIEQDFDVEILTSVGNHNPLSLKEQKEEWIRRYIGDDIIINTVNSGEAKGQYSLQHTLLVDDSVIPIQSFMNGLGHVYHHTSRNCPKDLEYFLEYMLDGVTKFGYTMSDESERGSYDYVRRYAYN